MTLALMTPKKAAAYLVLALLSAAWFASAVGMPPQSRPARTAPAPSTDDERLDALARDVQAQSSRLRERLAAAPAIQSPARNPFSFDRRVAPEGRRASRSVAAPPREPEPDPAPREPVLVLIGLAEQKIPEGIVRTAMISEDGEALHMATEGQRVAGRYVVVTVSADAVELKDETTGATRRLVLK